MYFFNVSFLVGLVVALEGVPWFMPQNLSE
jgi:hypothetical protein